MLAGTHNDQAGKIGLVIKADKEFDFSIRMKRDRMAQGPGRGYDVFGVLETIYFEPDRDCALDPAEAEGVGRRLYWPEGGPAVARSKPEQDLLIVGKLPLRRGLAAMPDVPDPKRPARNPYHVDTAGVSHVHLERGEKPDEAPMRKQILANVASAKFDRFLVFHPIAQIILITTTGKAQWGTFGSVRQPVSSLTSFDGTKMALLIDPYTGEMFFKGGRYDLSDQIEIADPILRG